MPKTIVNRPIPLSVFTRFFSVLWATRVSAPLLWAICIFALLGLSLFGATSAQAQTGTAGDPFTNMAHAHNVSSSGRYYFLVDGQTFQADVDTSEGGGWVLVLQYVHKGGTNPNMNVLGTTDDFPELSSASLGTDESGSTTKWGHARNAPLARFVGNIETRFYASTSDHSRIIHFSTTSGKDYIRTGSGSFAGIDSNFTALTGHTANIPASATSTTSGQGDLALTAMPFYGPAPGGGLDTHWAIKGGGNRWEVDNRNVTSTADTIHRVWVRAPELIDYGSSSASCPYIANFDSDRPGYDSTPYYQFGSGGDNGQHLSSIGAITSDASGSGKFLFHATGGTTNQSNGEAWGTTNAPTVLPNTYYWLGFKVANSINTNKPIFQPQINGTPVGSTYTNPNLGSWDEHSVLWYSGSATSADISLIQTRSTYNGVAWGFDDITLCGAEMDRSDAPTAYSTASHVVDVDYKMGAAIDIDASPIANADASGDGADDDGVTLPVLTDTGSRDATITVTQPSASAGYLQGWVDFNGDGDFTDAGEQVATDLQLTSGTTGTITVPITAPTGVMTGDSFARFRWSSTSGLDASTVANDGEVEDYQIEYSEAHGSSSASCPYIMDFDGDTPIYDSTPYYQFSSGNDNGHHLSSIGAITSDAGGSGQFLYHATGGVSGQSNGEAWGTANAPTVLPNTYYLLRFKMANNSSTNTANVTPQINGVDVGSNSVAPGTGVWTEFSTLWYSGSATSADISLIQARSTNSGVEWGFDDITLCGAEVDRSDAPTAYSTASHVVDVDYKMGAAIDIDASPIANADASGDGADDDGVTLPVLTDTGSRDATITVTQPSASAGYLQGWVDFNGDGDFTDAGEQVATDLQLTSGTTGTITVPITAPTGVMTGDSFARFRWSSTSGLDASTVANDGEVEDYQIEYSEAHGSSSASCPYIMDFDGDTPIYDSTPYYQFSSGNDNGHHLSSIGAITSDAGGSGQFLYHATGGVSGQSNGEAWGTANAPTVLPNTYYLLRFKMANNSSTNTANVTPQINGVDVGSNSVAPGTGVWTEFSTLWYSGSATSADISLIQARSTNSGVEWGFDDITLCGAEVDRSDAPTAYSTASHVVDVDYKMGAAIDIDASPIANADASGDGADDDGVTLPVLTDTGSRDATITVTQPSASAGYLQGWVDFNGDGDFTDAGEQVATDLQLTSGTTGTITVPITAPTGVMTGDSFARFRWSSTSGLDASTVANDGEVEDYQIEYSEAHGSSSASCPYIMDFDGDTPIYDSTPYYQFSSGNDNGHHLSSIGAITSDAGGSGQFLYHATGGVSGQSNGEAWGTANAPTVLPNTYYLLRFKMANNSSTNTANVTPQINGVDVGSNSVAPGTGVWTEFSTLWYSGSATSADISLIQARSTNSGVEWGFDDITLCGAEVDRSDAPTAYSTASHVVDVDYKMGAAIDIDASPIANADASGDGADDDGVTLPVLTDTGSRDATITVTQPSASAGYLQGWVDFNGDGDFTDAGEQVATDLQLTSGTTGTITVPITAPTGVMTGDSFARFRWSSTSGLDASTVANDGEVEDYQIEYSEAHGSSSASCPYIMDFDGDTPIYDSTPYYQFSSGNDNGHHLSSIGAITSDAGGSGQFLYHATGGVSGQSNGEAWGTANAPTVLPNTYYLLRFKMANNSSTNTAHVTPQINGVDVGSNSVAPGTGVWTEFSTLWYSGSATSADISLIQARSTNSGVEWGFDDITLCGAEVDRSDAPTAYSTASHVVDVDYKMGAAIDIDASPIANADASGDGADDDGVTLPVLTDTGSRDATITVTQPSASAGYLQGWVDFNGDGDFTDAGEQVATDLQLTSGTTGTITVPITAPTGVMTGDSFARFRWSSTSGLDASTVANDGEVEDYQIEYSEAHGSSSASCPYIMDFDGDTPIYDSTPYYQFSSGNDNGHHLSSIGAITSDAGGSGQFLYHATGGVSGQSNGEAWGTANAPTVLPNTYYLLRFKMANNSSTNTANVTPQINGVDVGSNSVAPGTGVWTEFSTLWYSGSATSADISLIQARSTNSGVEWGFDDITLCGAEVDRSDAPTAYSTASHVVDVDYKMGAAIDIDASPIANADASGDGADDDGVTLPVLTDTGSRDATITVTQPSASAGYLQGWVDFNGDGDFTDAGEQVATDLQLTSGTTGTITVPITAPTGVMTGDSFARFRWSSTSGLDASTVANDGEVEDYQIEYSEAHGSSSASCPYIMDFDGDTPIYDSTPYYQFSSGNDNGHHLSSIGAITSDAGGSGQFLYHATGGVSGQSNGEAWGTANAPTVLPNTYYLLRFKMANNSSTNTANVTPQINGVDVGSNSVAPGTGVWTEFSTLWYSGSATSADISLIQARSTNSGVEWGFDDITLCGAEVDRSDAPTAYSTASHVVDVDYKMGAAIDIDASPIANADASGDGADDDGVTLPVLTDTGSRDATITVTQPSASAGYLQGWVDFNGDGDFTDAGEQVATDLQLTSGTTGTITVPITAPTGVMTGDSFARFRWSSTSGLDASTVANDGEVEDYQIEYSEAHGSSSASCPYIMDFDGDTPIYDSTPYYQFSSGNDNGHHLSSIGAITSDAGGSGQFLYHATGGVSGQSNGEAWGTANAPTVLPNTYYLLRFKMANNSSTNTANVTPQINGVDVGSNSVAPGTGVWTEFSTLWYSGSATSADISLIQARSTNSGVEWGFDDITLCGAEVDRSDAPTAYSTASHVVDVDYKMGAAIDIDASPIANADASGDGADDDGVTLPVLTDTGSRDATITVTQPSASAGYLQGWVDFNGDGDFTDAGEQVATDLQLTSGTTGTITVPITAPTGVMTGDSFARFRWSSTSGLDASTVANDGEVEDYQIEYSEAHGSSSASCPYIMDFDGDTPIYDSTPYYQFGSGGDNGLHVASILAITSDASGSGKFLYHNTAGALPIGGEAWGTVIPPTVLPNTYYRLSFKMANNNNVRPQTIQPQINGVNVGSTHSTTTVSIWEEASVLWYSGSATSADISLLQQTPSGAGVDWGFDDITLCGAEVDWSDTPAAYPTASHILDTDYKMGALAEANSAALHDDNAAADSDDDGVTLPVLTLTGSNTASVTVTQPSASTGYLQGWVDFNGDGDFTDAGEQVATDLQLTSGTTGTITVPISVPAGGMERRSFARFRWSSTSGLDFSTLAGDGEVEDYWISYDPPATLAGGTCPNFIVLPASASATAANQFSASAGPDKTIDGSGIFLSGGMMNHNSLQSSNSWAGPTDTLDITGTYTMTGEAVNGISLWLSEAQFSSGKTARDFTFTITYDGGQTHTTSLYRSLDPVSTPQYFAFGQVFTNVTEVEITILDGWHKEGSVFVSHHAAPVPSTNFNLLLGEVYLCEGVASTTIDVTTESSIWDPDNLGLRHVPGTDLVSDVTVTNTGPSSTDMDSLFLVYKLSSHIEFYNGDIDDAGPESDPISFVLTSGSGVTFNYANDTKFYDGANPPASMAVCDYTPTAGYDPNVTFICINPKGIMLSTDPDTSFTFRYRSRIK